jgi:ferredoxin
MVAATLGMSVEELRSMDPRALDAMGGMMLKDESACIRCGLCASRCPTHAVTMKKFEFYRECVTVPTPNSKIQYRTSGPAPAAQGAP